MLYVLLTALCLFFLTPYPWYVSQINPDIFMGYFGTSVIILFFLKLNKWIRTYLFILIAFCAGFHNSVLLISLVFTLVIGVFSYFKKERKHLKDLLVILASCVLVYIGSATYNVTQFDLFTPNPSGHVFLMSRLMEMGIAQESMDELCVEKDYELCASYKKFHGRQWDFMWNDAFPHGKGLWMEPKVRKEYKEIINHTMTQPKFLLQYITINLKDAFKVLFAIKMSDGLQSFKDDSSPRNNINTFYPDLLPKFLQAKQQSGIYTFRRVNLLIKVSFISLLSVLIFLLFKNRKNIKRPSLQLIFLTISLLFLNAFITCSLSTYLDRFNSRVIWILPLALWMLYLSSKENNLKAIPK